MLISHKSHMQKSTNFCPRRTVENHPSLVRPTWLRRVLACPTCRGALEAREGRLRCAEGHEDPSWTVRRGIPRLLPPGEARGASESRTVEAFERQWRQYGHLRRIFGKDPQAMTANLHGARMGSRIDAAWYQGKRVLDAGCGHGRYLHAFASLGAEVVGLDIGEGPEFAGYEATEGPMGVVQGSVLAPPLTPESFDLVFSDGVIHHTPDARGAYLALARLVRPGGALYIWVYPREGGLREFVFGAGRMLTTRLPGPLVRALSFALAPLTLGIRSYSGTNLTNATWRECAQVVHDWIAPPLQSHHTQDEVESWAREAGLEACETLPIPTGLTAWKRA